MVIFPNPPCILYLEHHIEQTVMRSHEKQYNSYNMKYK